MQESNVCSKQTRVDLALIGVAICSTFNEQQRAEFEQEARNANFNVEYECRNGKLYYFTAVLREKRVTYWNYGANCVEQIKD